MGRALAQKWVMRMTDTVSTSWLTRVEPLLRSHRWRPLVSHFQKWKSCTSHHWAKRYAIIEAVTAPNASVRISKKTGTRPASSGTRSPVAGSTASKPGSAPPIQSRKTTQTFSRRPTHTTSVARLRP